MSITARIFIKKFIFFAILVLTKRFLCVKISTMEHVPWETVVKESRGKVKARTISPTEYRPCVFVCALI